MKRVMSLLIVVTLPLLSALWVSWTPTVVAAPAWGNNCLACHGVWWNGGLSVLDADGFADPVEGAAGAADRGLLPVYRTLPGRTRQLRAAVQGLLPADRYAVELTRLRFPGVESGGRLEYTGDCAWAEWGQQANYYTNPYVSARWGVDSPLFDYELVVQPDAAPDYYDLKIALAGRWDNTWELFYAEQHVYLQVLRPGDVNGDGAITGADLAAMTDCLAGPGAAHATGCAPADLEGDGDVDLMDFQMMQRLLGG